MSLHTASISPALLSFPRWAVAPLRRARRGPLSARVATLSVAGLLFVLLSWWPLPGTAQPSASVAEAAETTTRPNPGSTSTTATDTTLVRRPRWELGLGLAALRLPDYRGSDQSRQWLLPVPFVVYRGTWLRADREGARAILIDQTGLELDLSLAASAPTRSRDNLARTGMADLKPTLEFGPNLNLDVMRADSGAWKLELRLPLRAAFTIERNPALAGWTLAPTVNLDVQPARHGWNLGLMTGPVWGDRRFHQRVYGVADHEVTPLRGAYRASAGYGGWQSLASMSRRFEHTWVGAFVRHDNLNGAVFASSPLVRQTDAWTVGIAVSWVLGRSAEQVEVRE